MNERIKELAEQARAEVRADWAKGNKIPYPEAHYAFQRDNDQKFAQLIVRECAEVCYDHSRAAGGVDTDFGYGYKDCGDDIKRNFGVKE
jgi:hypothetical protein